MIIERGQDGLSAVQLGQGYSLVSDSALSNTCVVNTADRIKKADTQNAYWEFVEMESTESTASLLSANASLKARWGAGGASASVNYLKTTANSASSFNFAIRAVVESGEEALVESELKPGTSIANLRKRCGDAFVARIRKGAEFLAIVSIETRTESEMQALSGAFAGKYGSFSARAAFSQAVTSLLTSRKISTSVLRKGATGPVPALDDADSLRSYAENFPELVRQQGGGGVRSLTVIDYTVVAPSVSAAKWPGLESAWLNYFRSLRDLNALTAAKKNINNIICGREKYENIRAGITQLNAHIRSLEDVAAQCLNTNTNCNALFRASPIVEIPERYEREIDLEVNMDNGKSFIRSVTTGYRCSLISKQGTWNRYGGSPTATNAEACPTPESRENGTVFRSEYDSDEVGNVGVCKYLLGCVQVANPIKFCPLLEN